MAKQTINVGTTANDRTGDPLRVAFTKVNQNFTEVYNSQFSGNYEDLANTPFIPSDVSDLSDANEILSKKPYLEINGDYQDTNVIITFTKLPNVSSDISFDAISGSVSLTRDINGGGLYNRQYEPYYNSEISPFMTTWNWDGWDNLSNLKSRYFSDLVQVLENNIDLNIVGAELIMRDLVDDEYYKIKVTAWNSGTTNNGSFSYIREKINTSNKIGIIFKNGTNLNEVPDTRVKFPQSYVAGYSDHTLDITDVGRQIYTYDNIISIPGNQEQNFKKGDTIQIVVGDTASTIRVKPYNDIDNPDAVLYIQNETNAVTSYLIPARSMAILTKIRQNEWQLLTDASALKYIELTNDALITLPVVLDAPIQFTRLANIANTDFIDTGLSLARGNNGALYNPELELSYDNTNYTSPAGTEWNSDGWDDLSNLRSRSYDTLRSSLNNVIGENILNAELVMHDIINDKYYKFDFTNWGQNNGGSFAYTRTLIEDPNFFKKEDYATGNTAIDVFVADDGEGSGIAITRKVNQGIYNPFREGGWNWNVSPTGTLWNIDGWDNFSNIETRLYESFNNAYNNNLGNNVPGSRSVLYIPDTNEYYAIHWLSWTPNNAGGGFSYLKYKIDLTKLNEGIRFTDGTVLKSAEGIGRVKSTASNNRKIEEVSGSSTVSVTPIITTNLSTFASRTVTDSSQIYISTANTNIDDIISAPGDYNIYDITSIQFSIDDINWYTWNGSINLPGGDERNYGLSGSTVLTYTEGDAIYFRYKTGGEPVVWWDKNDLPGGSGNFRGAVIDYHAFTGQATWIGSIHIVDDSGENHISHTEVSSGSTDAENDDFWIVENEGTISYRRIDGEPKTLKMHWTAKVFYGSEFWD